MREGCFSHVVFSRPSFWGANGLQIASAKARELTREGGGGVRALIIPVMIRLFLTASEKLPTGNENAPPPPKLLRPSLLGYNGGNY